MITVFSIQQHVATHYGVRVQDIRGPLRLKRITLIRHITMLLARELTEASYPELGRAFGGRDHSSVMHGCKRIQRRCKCSPSLRSEVDRLRQAIVDPDGVLRDARGYATAILEGCTVAPPGQIAIPDILTVRTRPVRPAQPPQSHSCLASLPSCFSSPNPNLEKTRQ